MGKEIYEEDRQRVLRVLSDPRFECRSFHAIESAFQAELPPGYDYFFFLDRTLKAMLNTGEIYARCGGTNTVYYYKNRMYGMDSYDNDDY